MAKTGDLKYVPSYTGGEGSPYAPVNWPNPGDTWRWRVGGRVTSNEYYSDIYLIVPNRLQKRPRKKVVLRSKKGIRDYLKREFPRVNTDTFWDSFIWKVPGRSSNHIEGEGSMERNECDGVTSEYEIKMNVSDEGSPSASEDSEQGGGSGKEEAAGKEEGPVETWLDVACKKIRKLKRKEADKEERKRKELEKKERKRKELEKKEIKGKGKMKADVMVRRKTRSARKAALEQPIGVQFHNTKDDPVLIDDEEKVRTITVEGIELTAPSYYKNGHHYVKFEALVEVIEKALPSVTQEQREVLEEKKKKFLKKTEKKAA